MKIIEGDRKGPPNPSSGGCVSCPCGSAWFELKTGEDNPYAAVAVDGEFCVIAYAGVLHCLECHEPLDRTARRLRMVGDDLKPTKSKPLGEFDVL